MCKTLVIGINVVILQAEATGRRSDEAASPQSEHHSSDSQSRHHDCRRMPRFQENGQFFYNLLDAFYLRFSPISTNMS